MPYITVHSATYSRPASWTIMHCKHRRRSGWRHKTLVVLRRWRADVHLYTRDVWRGLWVCVYVRVRCGVWTFVVFIDTEMICVCACVGCIACIDCCAICAAKDCHRPLNRVVVVVVFVIVKVCKRISKDSAHVPFFLLLWDASAQMLILVRSASASASCIGHTTEPNRRTHCNTRHRSGDAQ